MFLICRLETLFSLQFFNHFYHMLFRNILNHENFNL